MTVPFDVLYKSLEEKIIKLEHWALALKEENNQLKAQIKELNDIKNQLELQLKECEEKKRLLIDAGVVSMVEKQDVMKTQQRIDNLVREIDQCIALITQE